LPTSLPDKIVFLGDPPQEIRKNKFRQWRLFLLEANAQFRSIIKPTQVHTSPTPPGKNKNTWNGPAPKQHCPGIGIQFLGFLTLGQKIKKSKTGKLAATGCRNATRAEWERCTERRSERVRQAVAHLSH
jgi:hypothetical protein